MQKERCVLTYRFGDALLHSVGPLLLSLNKAVCCIGVCGRGRLSPYGAWKLGQKKKKS